MVSAITSDLCCLFAFVIASAVIALAWLTLKERRSQKIDDLQLASQVLQQYSPAKLTLLLFMEALDISMVDMVYGDL